MSHHRAVTSGRRRAARARPRYGRLAVLGASVSVTAIALLGGTGVLPSVAEDAGDRATTGGADSLTESVLAVAEPSAEPSVEATPVAPPAATPAAPAPVVPVDPAVPADSGSGRRIVFDESDQRVWLVDDEDSVLRTYLVSGSLTDNLDPGTYSVYSRSANATGIEQSGTMRYFVRFTEGDTGAAIGFHDIPLHEGEPVQTTDQLGTPQSHGCIRQARKDATALWGFAPIGTAVVVTA